MEQDKPPKHTPLARRLGNFLRRSRDTGRPALGQPGVEFRPSETPLSAQELASVKRSYLRRLDARFRSLYLYGLDARRHAHQQSGQALELQAIYIPLNTVPPTTVGAPAAAGTPTTASATAKSGIWSSQGSRAGGGATEPGPCALERVGQHGRAIVRGSRGSGKSTLLHFLALALTQRSPDGECMDLSRLGPTWSHGCPFPVWVDLRALCDSPYDEHSAAGLSGFLAAEWNISTEQLTDQVILPGGLYFLFDGLEMASDAVASFYEQYKQTDNLFLLTSQAYVDLHNRSLRPLHDLTEITLAPWTLEQMDQFAGRWYAELECQEWIDPESARDLPGQLRSALRRDELAGLANRPALMVLLALLHTAHGQLPNSTVALYDRLIGLSLTQWTEGREQGGAAPADTRASESSAESRDLRLAFDLEALQTAIAQMTYEKYARLATPSDPIKLSVSELRAALVNVGRERRMEAVDTLISRMRTRPAILDEPQPGVYVYAHPCFEAHAAAYHLAYHPRMPQLARVLAYEDYDRWREIILLAGARLAELGDDLPQALDLADTLCHSSAPNAKRGNTPDIEWRVAWLAGEMLAQIGQETDAPEPLQTLACVEQWLTALVSQGQLTPSERTQAGSVLDRLPDGDTRPGVSSLSLLWCPVPGGDFWHGEGTEASRIHVGSFWMSRYPVTNAQYAAFVRATGRPPPRHWQGEHPPPGLDNHPVVYVTWYDSSQFCAWYTELLFTSPFLFWRLDQAEKLERVPRGLSRDWVIRLPMDLEWEKAARGGIQIPEFIGPQAADAEMAQVDLAENPFPHRTYPWGDDWQLSNQDSRGDETRCNVSESNIGTTTPVGMYPTGASPNGLLDMAGNVWEWCWDWADGQESYKVRRGGAFRFTHEHARCAASDKAHPGLGWPHLGFRVVLAPPQK